MVGADRGGPVAALGLQLHQHPVAGLLQWLELHPPSGHRKRA